MIIRTTKKTEENPENICSYCHVPYKKKDFSMCPHCGGDAGNRTPKSWRPTRKQKKQYVEKINKI